ncbi:MAG: hypothetical protein HYZ28_21920 [Myxococcales bacterium]|nr:hypothetical protein [Myxococcales bacterium]
MLEAELPSLPWPVLMVSRRGEPLCANASLLALLEPRSADLRMVLEEYEVCNDRGIPLRGERSPWLRAARGEEFDERQIWYSRVSGYQLVAMVRGYCRGDVAYIILEPAGPRWKSSACCR